MKKLGSLRTRIGELLSGDKSVALWLSGGSDSLLLLNVMMETGRPFGVLRFDDGWDREQRRQTDAVILRHGIQAFSYPPKLNMLVSVGEEIALLSGYAVDQEGNEAILGRDLVDNPKRCSIDEMIEIGPYLSPIEFDIHVWGTRKADRHWIGGDMELAVGEWWPVGTKQFTAPLWEWTRDEVVAALKSYGAVPPAIDTGDIRACANCLKGEGRVYCPKTEREIDSVRWDKAKNLEIARGLIYQP